jgi:hypothetical protein
MKFDYVAMENRNRLTWDRMPDSVREMILEAERMGAFQQRLYPDGEWVDEMIFRPQFGIYRIVNWRAPGAEPEPLAGMSANNAVGGAGTAYPPRAGSGGN